MQFRLVLPGIKAGMSHYTAGSGDCFSAYNVDVTTAIRLFDVDGENLIIYKELLESPTGTGQRQWRYHLLGKNATLNYVKEKTFTFENGWVVNEGRGSTAYSKYTIDGDPGDSGYTTCKNTIIWDIDWLLEQEMSPVTLPSSPTINTSLWRAPMGRIASIPETYAPLDTFTSTILGPDNYSLTLQNYSASYYDAGWLIQTPKSTISSVNYHGRAIPVEEYGYPTLLGKIADNFYFDPKTAEPIAPFEVIAQSMTAYDLVRALYDSAERRECAPRRTGYGTNNNAPWYNQNYYHASFDYTFTNNAIHPVIYPSSYNYFENALIMGIPVTESLDGAHNYVQTGELPEDSYIVDTDPETGQPYSWQGDDASDTTDDSHIDDMELPTPTKGGMVSGSNRYYLVTKQGMENFLSWFWYDLGTLQQVILNFLTSMYGNLKECILSYQYFPCTTAALGEMSENTSNIRLGSLESTQAAYTLDALPSSILLGEINVAEAYEHFGDFLDWEGYTNFQIYLPFAGIFELPTKSVQNRILKVYYAVDVASTALQYTVKAFAQDSEAGFIVFQTQIPFGETIGISLQDAMQLKTSILSSTVNAATDIAAMTVGLHTGSAVAASVSKGIGTSFNIEKGKATASQSSGNNTNSNTIRSRTADIGFNTGQVVHDLLQFKSDVPSAVGQTNGLVGKWSPLKCYLLVDRPIEYRPKNYGKYIGYLYYKYNQLGLMSGYTTCINPQIEFKNNAPLIKEIEEIYRLLQTGIII